MTEEETEDRVVPKFFWNPHAVPFAPAMDTCVSMAASSSCPPSMEGATLVPQDFTDILDEIELKDAVLATATGDAGATLVPEDSRPSTPSIPVHPPTPKAVPGARPIDYSKFDNIEETADVSRVYERMWSPERERLADMIPLAVRRAFQKSDDPDSFVQDFAEVLVANLAKNVPTRMMSWLRSRKLVEARLILQRYRQCRYCCEQPCTCTCRFCKTCPRPLTPYEEEVFG